MARKRRKIPFWINYSIDELLDLRLKDLKINIADSSLEYFVGQLHDELDQRNINFKPHCWLSDEWFSPDAVPGIAIPFYLSHLKLTKLEAQQVYAVEGGTDRACMQYLRHEAGHAICTAYQLYRRKKFKQLFGRFNKPYPKYYRPNPKSKNYVMHLDWWYAQSHPAEDFAETFAVWLKPRSQWRKEYEDWTVIKKLVYVEEIMADIQYKKPINSNRSYVDPISKINKSLREHYQQKRSHYGVNLPHVYDSELIRLFKRFNDDTKRRGSAAIFLKKYHSELCEICSRGAGMYPYDIAQILQDMIVRCRELKLSLYKTNEDAKIDVAIYIVMQTQNFRQRISHRIAI
jgi:hypothetical protein